MAGSRTVSRRPTDPDTTTTTALEAIVSCRAAKIAGPVCAHLSVGRTVVTGRKENGRLARTLINIDLSKVEFDSQGAPKYIAKNNANQKIVK